MSDAYPSSTPKGKQVAHATDLVPPRPPPAPAPIQQESGLNSDKDADRPEDKGSLSTTVTGTRSQTRFSMRKGTKLSDEGAHDASRTPEKPSATKSAKLSFFTKLVRVLVPCVGPSNRAHSHEVADVVSDLKLTEKDPQSNGQPPANGRPLEDSGHQNGEPSTSPPIASVAPPPPPVKPLAVPLVVPPPTLPIDAEIVVPPTPTKSLLPHAETEGVTSGAVQPPGSRGEELVHNQDDDIDEINALDDLEDEEDRLILNGGIGIPIGPDGVQRPLLPPLAPHHAGRKCLVLDLDETLLHSSFKSIQHADYVVPVEIEYHWHNVYVIKRPGVDNFLKKMGELYEIVVFTASLSKYADPVLDKLDVHRVVSHRLFRESCYNHKGNYVKDLSQLGRPMTDTIILDNSPASYIFHPNNAVPVSSWFNDPHDTELTDLCPFLSDLRIVDDVRTVLDGGL